MAYMKKPNGKRYIRFVTQEEIDEIKAEIKKKEEQKRWHTGTPTEAGLYVIAFRFGNKIEHEIREMFYSPDYGMTFGIKKDIVAWLKIEPYKEKEDGHID